MVLISECISRKLSADDLESELMRLISQFNKLRQTFTIAYITAVGKPIPDVILNQDDYYIINDLLWDVNSRKVDIYLETAGVVPRPQKKS